MREALNERGPLTAKDLVLHLATKYRDIAFNEICNILAKYPEFIKVGYISPYESTANKVPLWGVAKEEE
tara:strand:+ start:5203 stop:5409 length:207 start_codon:yes stop_codon:yes gene_type:complete